MTDQACGVPEVKGTAIIDQAFEGFMRTFEAFRETNDQRLKDLETRRADVLTTERLARIERSMDEQKSHMDRMVLAANRPPLGDGARRNGVATPADLEHRAAFDAYVRTGTEGNLRALEAKALSAGVGADGGFTVTPQIDAEIGRRLAVISPIRSIASVRTMSAGTFRKPYRLAGAAVGWVAETAARPQTNSPTLAELVFPAMELYAMPSATQMLLDDTAVDVDQWLVEEIELAFATQEGQAFVAGDGLARPRGFLAVPTVAEAAWAWGSLGYLVTGVSGGWPAANPSDVLVDLIYALKAGYRQNATFVMNRKTQAAVRKLKDSTGEYLWKPPASADGRASLMGFPVTEAEDMPDVSANSLAVAFGDFRRGYLVVDRIGTRVLRDPYSAKPYVLFYTTKRVGGGVQDFDAIKLLKFGTT
ncbi:phage major capsid protein [Chthonobacter rhizosphaerae]|uniref:phage major capsid protein n=1 Tax=Chthonobacter rhizosphaerae TaxID=2735553 RepID=UPI0015EE8320|nr:phage major capsid protein [Chthonobacter rhizosphaerae]